MERARKSRHRQARHPRCPEPQPAGHQSCNACSHRRPVRPSNAASAVAARWRGSRGWGGGVQRPTWQPRATAKPPHVRESPIERCSNCRSRTTGPGATSWAPRRNHAVHPCCPAKGRRHSKDARDRLAPVCSKKHDASASTTNARAGCTSPRRCQWAHLWQPPPAAGAIPVARFSAKSSLGSTCKRCAARQPV